jgi:hypothetical protein
VIRGLAPEMQRAIILSVGTHRGARRLSPTEVGAAFAQALEAGTPARELAAFVHFRDATMVGRFTRLNRLSPDVKYLVDWNKPNDGLGFSVASELVQLPEGDHEPAARRVIELKLSKDEVKQVVQLRRRSHKAIDDCFDDILRLRPQVVRQHIFIGAVRESLREPLAKLDQAARNLVLKSALDTVLPTAVTRASRLGIARFSLVGDDALAAQLRRLTPDFESSINTALGGLLLKA